MFKFIEEALRKSEEFGYIEGFSDGLKYALNHQKKGYHEIQSNETC